MGLKGEEILPVARAVDDWSEKKLFDGKNIKELLDYQDISLWWFVWYWILKKGRYLPYNLGSIYQAAEKGDLKSLEKSAKMRFLKAYAHSKLLDVRVSALGLRKTKTGKNTERPKVVVIAKSTGMRRMKDPKTGRDKRGNVYLEPIIEKLKDRGFDVVRVERRFALDRKLQGLRNYGGWSSLESYEPGASVKIARGESKRLMKLWEGSRNHTKGSMVINGHDVSEYLLCSLDALFKQRIPQAIRLINTVENLLKLEKPDAVLFLSDGKDGERAISVACRKNGIPCFGVAHAVVSETSYSYLRQKTEMNGLDIKAPYVPLPDCFMVYGELDKERLTKHNYPAKQIAVVGQPRYDILAKAGELYNRSKTFKKLGLDESKRLILMTTQSHGIPREENEITFKEVYEAAKSLSSEAELVLKLHPNEKELDIYEWAAEKTGFRPKIVQDFDTMELMNACDVLIQKWSNTALEGMMMGKPVISANYKINDLLGASQAGAVFVVSKEGEMQGVIERALSDKKAVAALARKAEAFVKLRYYKADGKASERVADIIEKGLRKR